MVADTLAGSFSLGETIAAIGALGTAAFGLVDATKVFWGGVSNAGFATITGALKPFTPALDQAVGAGNWRNMLVSHWLNGRPADEQKAIARSMIRLGTTPATAPALAAAGHVDAAALAAVAAKLAEGAELTPNDLNVLGRLDASVEMTLDAAFERADQQYRSSARMLAGVFAVGLSLVGVIYVLNKPNEWPLAVMVGVLAVPISPIAKDLASSLSSAVNALKAVKG